ncbi:ABC transporter ATP-binding protein [Bifidobacterium callitrichos]|uniref:ABC transporter ATP-binding protein n=1 Tax=Bifidobacterium callitrichos DSM 23973 TaxID=1437609 RepID=A0A087ACZ1_9BIFI|nr:energy-coupling factor ABC transporter ATP-binding protein [Bifidobacterium callitrichos]KFI56641.1 ABC transporter ATP-binding protein [Bifidobacterium callitrichos DSM 23973]
MADVVSRTALDMREVSFRYDAGDAADAAEVPPDAFADARQTASPPALDDASLRLAPGECVVLCGGSGCGKTTLTRVANGLIPSFFHGVFTGSCLTCGLDTTQVPIDRLTPLTGSVFQNPKTQYFNANSTDELAFPCENMGMETAEINRRVSEVAERFGVADLLERDVLRLSGGQRQRIAMAAANMLEPRLVVLDEPTSNLDSSAIDDMRLLVARMKADGVAVLVAEHRLAWLNGVADRYVVFKSGRIVRSCAADEFLALSPDTVAGMGLRALDLEPYRQRVRGLVASEAASGRGADGASGVPLLRTRDLVIGHDRRRTGLRFGLAGAGRANGRDHRGVQDRSMPFRRAVDDLTLYRGQIVGLMGRNGAGKTTLVRTLTGLMRPLSGQIELDGRVANAHALTRAGFMVMQDVNYQLFSASVREELMLGFDEDDADARTRCDSILDELDLTAFADRHPMSLSGGQKQRVAIGSALMCGKDLIVLDEPTSGLDRLHMEQVGRLLRRLADSGRTLLVVTHDEELAAGWCDRIVMLSDQR